MTFAEAMEHVAQVFEAIGAAVLLAGLVVAVGLAVRVLRRSGDGTRAFQVLRQAFAGVILLGLEVLVAADLVRTVAVEPTWDNVVILGVIILIRTVLSFSLVIEIEGVAPWRRAATSGAAHIARAVEAAGRAGRPRAMSAAPRGFTAARPAPRRSRWAAESAGTAPPARPPPRPSRSRPR